MPLNKSKSKTAFKQNMRTEMAAGKPQKQALAIAYSVARKSPKKKMYAEGGLVEDEDNISEGSFEVPDDSPLRHDEHEDFLTDYDNQDPFNDLPERQPADSMHEEVNSAPPENMDGSEDSDMLRELMRRRYSRR